MGMQHTNDCHWQRQQLTGDTRRIGRRRKGTLQEFKDSSTAIYFSSSCALVSFSTTICPRVLLSFIVVVVYAVLLLFFCCCCCGSVVAVLWSFECTVLWLFAYVLNNFFALVLFLVFCLRMVFLCVCLFLVDLPPLCGRTVCRSCRRTDVRYTVFEFDWPRGTVVIIVGWCCWVLQARLLYSWVWPPFVLWVTTKCHLNINYVGFVCGVSSVRVCFSLALFLWLYFFFVICWGDVQTTQKVVHLPYVGIFRFLFSISHSSLSSKHTNIFDYKFALNGFLLHILTQFIMVIEYSCANELITEWGSLCNCSHPSWHPRAFGAGDRSRAHGSRTKTIFIGCQRKISHSFSRWL